MRSISIGAVLLLSATLGCSAHLSPVDYWRPPNEPIKVVVMLHRTPGNKCVSVTLPQVIWVDSGDKVQWDVVNTCPGNPEVAMRFERAVVTFQAIDRFPADNDAKKSGAAYEARRDGRPTEQSPPFRYRAEGTAQGDRGLRVKYRIIVDGQEVEDPGIGFKPPGK
jgi:hypothetical protein